MVKELETKFNASKVRLDPEDLVTPELNLQIATQDYKNRHRLASMLDKISEEYSNHLKKGDFNFHLEKYEALDLGASVVYVKSLQRLTPKLNLQETEEIELDTLKEKDEPFDIAAAFKVDFEEDDAPEESPGKSKKTDEALGSPSKKLTGTEATLNKDPLAKPSTFQIAPTKDALVDPVPIPEGIEKDISVKSGSRRSDLNLDKPNVAPGAENVQGSDARASPLNEAASTGKPASTDQQKLGSEAIKDLAADASQKDEAAKEIDLEAEQRLREEEAKRATVYEKLLTIKPTLRTLKKWHVSTLDNHYELCLHPEPLFPKHCVLTKNGRIKYDTPLLKYKAYEEKVDKRVRISDFSDIHRLRVDSWSEKVRVEELANIEYSTLNSRFLDLRHLFTVHDLAIMDGLLKQLDCFVFYRVLPDGAKDHKSLMNQVVHLVPKQDLLDEVNGCMKGFIQVDELDLIRRLTDWTEVPFPADTVAGSGVHTGLVRDKTIEDHHQRLLEIKLAREEKLRRIEEKRLRREARERALQEKLEAERKAAEEAAAREREALKNPAKAAALRIEKEKAAAAAAAAEQEKLEKERQQAESEPTEPVEGAAPALDPEAADVEQQELIESAIPQVQENVQFVNKFADSFFRFTDWEVPHRIYRRTEGETPEALEEALEYLVLALAHEFAADIDLNKVGVNLLICRSWVMVVPILKPWNSYGDVELYWEPWSYLGFFTVPVLKKTWPETKDLSSHTFTKDVKNFVQSLTKAA